MTRREFLEQMFISVFDVKGIQYLNTNDGVAQYRVGGTDYSDCSYSYTYRMKFNCFWKALFNSDNKEVDIKKNNGKSQKSNIEKYRNRAKDYILSIISSNEKDNVVYEENLTLKLTEHIYINIILKELFDVELLSNDNGNDDFEISFKKIKNEIIEFIADNHEYSKEFFNDIIEKYPVFGKLQLDEKNELVYEDIKETKEFMEASKIPLSTVNLELQNLFSIRDNASDRSKTLASYIDKPSMEAVNFELLISIINELYTYSECYVKVFSKYEIETFINTAVRAYNHFYGKNHVVYTGKTNNRYEEMHQHLIEYLFMLQLVINSKLINDDDKKFKEWYK